MVQTTHEVRWRESSLLEERQRRSRALNIFVPRVKEQLQPTCIILFGSTATGLDRLESDLDVVIIGGHLPARQFDRLDLLGHLALGISVSIDAFAYTEEEFERMLDQFHVTALDALYQGRPLYGEEYFARLHQKLEQLLAQGLRRSAIAWTVPSPLL